jgi:transposase
MLSATSQSVPGRSDTERRRQLAKGPRRRYSLDFKRQILQEIVAPGASVSVVARRHGLNTNVVFRWRRQLREGQLGDEWLPVAGFLPIHVAEEVNAAVPAMDGPTPGLIEIETAEGIKLRLFGRVDDRALRLVLAAIRRSA